MPELKECWKSAPIVPKLQEDDAIPINEGRVHIALEEARSRIFIFYFEKSTKRKIFLFAAIFPPPGTANGDELGPVSTVQ